MIKAQEWLDKNYPKNQRGDIKKLDISKKNLEGTLDLSDFVNLEELDCSNNFFTCITIVHNNKQLLTNQLLDWEEKEEIAESNSSKSSSISEEIRELNKLMKKLARVEEEKDRKENAQSQVELNRILVPDNLTSLDISNNNFLQQDLSIFSWLVSLQRLLIGNSDEEKFQSGIYNKFCGSLSYLKSLTKLECLDISNTDVDGGLAELSKNEKWM
ncbi:hypothetical protein [endosymbiont GvMRE of Glomus versiforme]|uniref:hypothetical protein n=1 Tax=endosymbiont GvMRE of Glomus versiforme TaxID=2039283 RepID=UPI000EC4C38D|nr:hypothetical protein [endosymbiont GvMRE of Glomus versiforme]RHZ35521.1 Serine/threonine protein kinase [endosymbiont GvMRE of Glomus versiforme]